MRNLFINILTMYLSPFFRQFHDFTFDTVLIRRKKGFKNDLISSSILKFSKHCHSSKVSLSDNFLSVQRFFPFMGIVQQNTTKMFHFEIDANQTKLLWKLWFFFLWNKFEQSGIKLHNEFAYVKWSYFICSFVRRKNTITFWPIQFFPTLILEIVLPI